MNHEIHEIHENKNHKIYDGFTEYDNFYVVIIYKLVLINCTCLKSVTYRPTIYLYTTTPQVAVFVYKWKCLDHAEGTNSKSEVTQSNISASLEIKERKLGQHDIVLDTIIRNTPRIR